MPATPLSCPFEVHPAAFRRMWMAAEAAASAPEQASDAVRAVRYELMNVMRQHCLPAAAAPRCSPQTWESPAEVWAGRQSARGIAISSGLIAPKYRCSQSSSHRRIDPFEEKIACSPFWNRDYRYGVDSQCQFKSLACWHAFARSPECQAVTKNKCQSYRQKSLQCIVPILGDCHTRYFTNPATYKTVAGVSNSLVS